MDAETLVVLSKGRSVLVTICWKTRLLMRSTQCKVLLEAKSSADSWMRASPASPVWVSPCSVFEELLMLSEH